jgi:DNA-binding NarL/FixJ family response regulator
MQPHNTTKPPDPGLREAQVLALVARGWTNRQIRAELGLTPHTLASLLGRLYLKSGIYAPGQSFIPGEQRRHLVAWSRTLRLRGAVDES